MWVSRDPARPSSTPPTLADPLARGLDTPRCLAGKPPGKYAQWGQEFEVLPSGKVVVPGTAYLAGSGDFTDACVARAITLGGVSLAEALDMAGARPRALLGLDRRELEPGLPADLMLFDWRPGDDTLRVKKVLRGPAA